jgi:hypothetical protein
MPPKTTVVRKPDITGGQMAASAGVNTFFTGRLHCRTPSYPDILFVHSVCVLHNDVMDAWLTLSHTKYSELFDRF